MARRGGGTGNKAGGKRKSPERGEGSKMEGGKQMIERERRIQTMQQGRRKCYRAVSRPILKVCYITMSFQVTCKTRQLEGTNK